MPHDDDNLAEPLNPAGQEGGSSSKKGPIDPESVQLHSGPIAGEDGLSSAQAAELLKQWGPNALPENKKSKLMLLLLSSSSSWWG